VIIYPDSSQREFYTKFGLDPTLSLFPFTLSLFGTDFILKIITRIKEKVLINGIKI